MGRREEVTHTAPFSKTGARGGREQTLEYLWYRARSGEKEEQISTSESGKAH